MSEHTQLEFAPELSAAGLRFAIVVSRFNSFITAQLLAGALDALERHGADLEQVRADLVHVPGAWEIPLAARALAVHRKPDAIVCLGAVIRGETPHFHYVAEAAARGIAEASKDTGIPMAFGVLTTDNAQQARERAGGKAGNKGFDAAMTAIEMANLLRRLRAES